MDNIDAKIELGGETPKSTLQGFLLQRIPLVFCLTPCTVPYCETDRNGERPENPKHPATPKLRFGMTGPQKYTIKSNTWVNLRRLVALSCEPRALRLQSCYNPFAPVNAWSSASFGSRLLHGCGVGDLFCSLSIFQGPPRTRSNDFSQRPKPM